ncbi:MAG TPA: FAD-binding oxidoreductase [Ktedonobacteraceae bacterium]|jgi:glycine/D-amino acid oxidase-like deaminating enzyme|nr:FAD-binding oxidoreductase [Ktedonobacteraceae bacterium]
MAHSSSAEHVVIIGGGASGALIAVQLAERGFRVTVVEKAQIGNGSSSRSAAGIRAQFSTEETVVGMQYSEWWYRHFHEFLHSPPEVREQPVFRQNGYLFLYEAPDAIPAWQPRLRQEVAEIWQQAQAAATMQQRVGLPVEVLSPQAVRERWPHLLPDRLIGATWCPTDGFLLPHMIYTEGFRRAKELGVQIQQQTEVLGARLYANRITALITNKGTIEADWVINATNAWASHVSSRIGGMSLPVSPTKRYLYFLKPAQPVMDADAWHCLPMTIYGIGSHRGAHSRPEHDLLLLAWAHETTPEPDFSEADQDRIDPPFRHDNGIDNYGCAILEQVEQFSPLLANAGGLVATTSGFYGMTPDANPLIGFDIQQQNLIHAVGFSGHGLMHAPITALLVEALLTGEAKQGHVPLPAPFNQATIDISTFAPGRSFGRSRKETLVL